MKKTALSSMVKNTFSMSDLFRRADILQRFLEHFFFELSSPADARVSLLVSYYKDSDAETIGHANAVAAWGADVLNEYTAENLYENIRQLKQEAQLLPKLTVYVPVRLEASQIERIGNWCRTEIQADIMMDLKLDEDVVGGCAFAYNNMFHDVSFSYFSNKDRTAIRALLQKYDS